MSLVPSIDRVTQVVIDGLLSFLFCGKKLILNTLGRIARSYELYAAVKENFFAITTVFALGSSIEKNCFKMEIVLLLFLVYGTK